MACYGSTFTFTGFTVRGLNPAGEEKLPVPVQTGPEAHPASCAMDTGSFSSDKAAGAWCYHPPPSNAEVENGLELYHRLASLPA